MPRRDPSPPGRESRVEALGADQFDLLVIGGGVTGCGVARDAALRGLRVALVEKEDFGSGTSSRSSRLVHGGIRYLEHGRLHLVFESSAERRRLLRLAPHLVRPLSFTWPVYEGARVSAWKLAAGLALYDALALFRNVGRHRRLRPDDVIEQEPALRRGGLRGIREVLRRLGVEAPHAIFGHTHRSGPWPQDDPDEWSTPAGTRIVNTGSWVYQPHFLSERPNASPYWPGTAVVVEDDGPPRLIRLLGDRGHRELSMPADEVRSVQPPG
jgi:hypothetical protein